MFVQVDSLRVGDRIVRFGTEVEVIDHSDEPHRGVRDLRWNVTYRLPDGGVFPASHKPTDKVRKVS